MGIVETLLSNADLLTVGLTAGAGYFYAPAFFSWANNQIRIHLWPRLKAFIKKQIENLKRLRVKQKPRWLVPHPPINPFRWD